MMNELSLIGLNRSKRELFWRRGFMELQFVPRYVICKDLIVTAIKFPGNNSRQLFVVSC